MRAETWADVPTVLHAGRLTIYVPVLGQLPTILPRSAIVGPDHAKDGYITIDFEGALHASEAHATYEGRLVSAAGRHLQNYPTVARMSVPEDDLCPVGLYDGAAQRIERIDARETLARWLAPEPLPAHDVITTDPGKAFLKLRGFASMVPETSALARFVRNPAAMSLRVSEVVDELERLEEIYRQAGLPNGAGAVRDAAANVRAYALRTPAAHDSAASKNPG